MAAKGRSQTTARGARGMASNYRRLRTTGTIDGGWRTTLVLATNDHERSMRQMGERMAGDGQREEPNAVGERPPTASDQRHRRERPTAIGEQAI